MLYFIVNNYKNGLNVNVTHQNQSKILELIFSSPRNYIKVNNFKSSKTAIVGIHNKIGV